MCKVRVFACVFDVGMNALVYTVDAYLFVASSCQSRRAPAAEWISLCGSHAVATGSDHCKEYAARLPRCFGSGGGGCRYKFYGSKGILQDLQDLLADVKLRRIKIQLLQGYDVHVVLV